MTVQVPIVAPATAERLWRQFQDLGDIHTRRAQQATSEAELSYQRALAYLQQIPPERLAELMAERSGPV